MFTRHELFTPDPFSGLHRPRTQEESWQLEDSMLHVNYYLPFYTASIASLLSPRSHDHIKNLATIVRDRAEPYVQTRIPHGIFCFGRFARQRCTHSGKMILR